jgi:hypothetical protein
MRQDATLRKLEVIGQAVKNLSEGTKLRQPDIPWKQIAGMRDTVIHNYFRVNLEIIWAVVHKESRNSALRRTLLKDSWVASTPTAATRPPHRPLGHFSAPGIVPPRPTASLL